ncbi:helix-turn-helix domain-containing protein [Nocardia thraciensis]
MRRERLIQARKATGKNQEEVAELAQVDRTTIGKWERGESTPQPNQRPAYAEALGVSLQELNAMLSSIPQGVGEMPDWVNTYLAGEQSADAIESYEPRAVHGLLQTRSYTAALVSRVGISGASDTYVQSAVEQRIYRQKRVRNQDLRLLVIQPEWALRLKVGDPATMTEQLETLIELSELPNVTVRVVTFDAGQHEARRLGAFSILSHPWGSTPRVHLEQYGGGQFITDAEEVGYFSSAFEHATKISLSVDKSRKFIDELAQEWRSRK